MTPELTALVASLKEQQQQLRQKIQVTPLTKPVHLIAGCDSAFIGEYILSVFVIFSYPSLEELEVQYNVSKVELPYIPGFLAFREAPNLLLAYAKLRHKPDLIMVDGHGIMHPRRMGIAAHLGVLLNIPTIGIAKKKLIGKYEMPSVVQGSASYVSDKGETLGVALRSKENILPIFISPGHLCSIDDAFTLVQQTLRGYKLPEPTRIADKYSKSLKETVHAEVISNA
jgi:deoxyribonuclease V